jgi:serine/threonine-protein kinase
VAVHEVGDYQGQFFFTMQYVAGRSLSELLKARQVSAREAARYIHQVALAVAHAHRHNVLHRDLKPSNVLVDSTGQARVTDFGLAKLLTVDSEITASGQILGTPSYMSPEQAGARQSQIGPGADIYSIGALLYHLLTGRPPFQADTPMETLTQVREHDPVLPRVYQSDIPRNLEMICMKCLEKRSKHRYPTARALARDLRRFLEGESVSLASVKLFDRLVQALERGHYDVEMRSWGTMCQWFAAIVASAHVLIFIQRIFLDLNSTPGPLFIQEIFLDLNSTRDPPPHALPWFTATRAWEFLCLVDVMWLHRRDCYPPRSLPSRQIWALWAGYLGGSVVLAYAGVSMSDPTITYEPFTLYPQLAVLSGMGFFVMGSSYWGGCHLIAVFLMALALVFLIPGMLAWAPLAFGLAWGASLFALGRHLRTVTGA